MHSAREKHRRAEADARARGRSPPAGTDPLERFHIRAGDRGLRLGVLWCLIAHAARWCLLLAFDLRVRSSHRVPMNGAAILAVNHASYLDPVIVNASLRRRCCFLARDSLFRIPGLGWLIRMLDAYPLARESRAPKEGYKLSLKILEKKRLLLVFPEGTRSRDGRLGRLRRGVALLARRSRVPVIPVWIEGGFRAWPRWRRLPRPHPVRVSFGEPLMFSEDGRASVDVFLDRLRTAMERLDSGSTQSSESVATGRETVEVDVLGGEPRGRLSVVTKPAAGSAGREPDVRLRSGTTVR